MIKRRRFVLYALLFVFGMTVIGALVAVWMLNPAVHFRNVPILAIPDPVVTDAPNHYAIKLVPGVSSNSANPGETFNLLLLGNDARSPNQPAHTDSIILIHADLKLHRYDILSIPRDLRVDIPPYGFTKITHANYMGDLTGGIKRGTRDIIQAVSNLTGLPINYYAETDYWGLREIVDALGGIYMDVPFPVYMNATWYAEDYGKTIPAGIHFLNGMVLTDLVHQRDYVLGGDFGRQKLQEEALIGIVHRLVSANGISHLPKFLNALPSFLVTTNVSMSDMFSMAMDLKGFHANEIHYFQVPGHPWAGKDPIVGTVLDYWVANSKQLQHILKLNF